MAQGVAVEKLDRPGAALIPLRETAGHVIILDAMQGGGEPGRISHFDSRD